MDCCLRRRSNRTRNSRAVSNAVGHAVRGCLLLAQSLHWVYKRGAVRRDEAGQERGEQQSGGNGAERREINRADIVKNAVHRFSDSVGTRETKDEPDAGEEHPFLQDQL
jgi:hypothetical protein